ncbi:p115 like vesicle tethering protein [Sparassis latifolia]
MEFLSQTYIALRGPTGAPQSPADTIGRLADRLSPSTLLADRRAAVLTLKGLSRDHGADIGERALLGLIDVLQNDAEIDADIGKAVLETLNILCEVDYNAGAQAQAREIGFKHTDVVLADEKVAHKLFALLGDQSFYLRLSVLQFLSTLLQNRPQVVQGYFLKAPVGPTSFVAVLEEKREIIRHEAIFVLQSLISQSPEIQKILAFEGAFERLFNIVATEGGIEGGTVVHEALACIDGLLRFNQSNQSYLRATSLPPLLLSLLGFPPNLPHDAPPPQGFALQLWDDAKKRPNAILVVAIIGLLAKGSSSSQDPLTFPFNRCLLELGLASNAPTSVKAAALRRLPSNLSSLPLAQMTVTPYMPVPDTNGEEWDRLEPSSALDVLVELVLHGEYNGMLEGERRSKDGIELRGVALGVFQNFVQNEEIAEAIVGAMVTPQGSAQAAPVTPLLYALIAPPSSPLNIPAVTSTHLAALLFSHLLRASPRAKAVARSIVPPTASSQSAQASSFFVPADGGPPPADTHEEAADVDEPQTLLQILSEHLSLAFLARGRPDTPDREAREWDRLLVGYLTLLVQWLWEDPRAVREFLEAGALSVLVEPINQTTDTDAVIPGLCVFLLGVCYEFNREPGEITRTTIYPILTRLGVDMLVGRITHLRDDVRFKAVGPDVLVLPSPNVPHLRPPPGPTGKPEVGEAEIWFDWAFVDFWKSNYYTVQKGIAADPKSLSSAAGQGAETAMLVASLRDVIRNQATEIEALRTQLKGLSPAAPPTNDREELLAEISSLKEAVQVAEDKRREGEKEQEDLLVLLDELNSKRRRDKVRMREAGMEVSEDEDEGEGAGDEEEDE